MEGAVYSYSDYIDIPLGFCAEVDHDKDCKALLRGHETIFPGKVAMSYFQCEECGARTVKFRAISKRGK